MLLGHTVSAPWLKFNSLFESIKESEHTVSNDARIVESAVESGRVELVDTIYRG